MTNPLTLYDYLPSGNGYKVRMVLKQLGIPYRLVEVDIKKGLTRTSEFLAKNPNGRIPLLEINGLGFLSESHAIIWYLAENSRLVPTERLQRAQLWQWTKHRAAMVDGRCVTGELVEKIIREEIRRLQAQVGPEQSENGKYDLASELFIQMTNSQECPEFLTSIAYELL